MAPELYHVAWEGDLTGGYVKQEVPKDLLETNLEVGGIQKDVLLEVGKAVHGGEDGC